ncbi:hypothetical protein TWF173_004119 [Orbilia oligospora]|nr:hypothetical protein TWF173_004119 [Orbilia oligospora]
MPPDHSAKPYESKHHDAAAVLIEGINTFSQAISSSQRKRKRGVSDIIRSGDEPTTSRLDVKDLDTITGNSRLRSSLKGLVGDSNFENPSNFNDQKLAAPVPHAAQIRLNRQEAYSTTKQTLNKWTDAVQSARSAEQLRFPLEGSLSSPFNNRKYHSSHQSGRAETRPPTKLEDRISQTLSLATRDLEESKSTQDSRYLTNSRSKHTKTKTAHLRMERELLLRKEAKAKRLRKIKSKSYRRILRKDQRKLDTLPPSLENSDPDGTEGTLEEGVGIFRIDNGSPGREQSDNTRSCQNINEKKSMLLGHQNGENLPGQRLFAMKFMDAEKRNTIKDKPTEVSDIREIPKGRRIFHDGLLASHARQIEAVSTTNKKAIHSSDPEVNPLMDPKLGEIEEKSNPWLCPMNNNNKLAASLSAPLVSRKHEDQPLTPAQNLNDRHTAVLNFDPPPPGSHLSYSTPESVLPSPAPQVLHKYPPDAAKNEQSKLLARAFAGDNILTEVLDQPPKRSSRSDRDVSGLQGWGAWGVSLGNSGRSHKQKGVSRRTSESYQTRVEKVVLNQQLCKKGVKYLATNLPYPFETSDQYERSLRFPIGQEWSTKQTHQTLAAPKVIVRGGTVIAPLS